MNTMKIFSLYFIVLLLALGRCACHKIRNNSTNMLIQPNTKERESRSCKTTSTFTGANLTEKVILGFHINDEKSKLHFYLTNIIKALNVTTSCNVLKQCQMEMSITSTMQDISIPSHNGTRPTVDTCTKGLHLKLCDKSLTISNHEQCKARHKELLSPTEENLLALFCILIDTEHAISKLLYNSTNCTPDSVRCSCNSVIETDALLKRKKNVTIVKPTNIHPTIQQTFQNELKTMCHEFEVDEEICNCTLFEIRNKNHTVGLCDIMGTTQGLINYNGTKSSKIWIRYITEYSCSYFHLSDSECQCQMLHAIHESQSKDLCKVDIEGPLIVDNLQQLCDAFGIAPAACSCKLFSFKEEDPTYKTFCQLQEYLNSTVTIVNFNPNYSRPFAIIGTSSSIIAIIGNGLVIIMALRFRRGLPRCKKLFAHLAACDLIFAILQFVYFVPKYWDSRWKYGMAMCKILKSTEMLGSMVAIGIVLIISIERYIGILEPFQRGLSPTVVVSLLCLNVLMAVLSIVPLLYYHTIDRIGICRIMWPDKLSIIYNAYAALFYFLIPVVTISFLYTKIVLNLRGTVTFSNSNWIADPRLRKKRITDNRRTMYMLLAVVIAFVLLVLPFHFVRLYLDAYGLNGEYIPTEKMSTTTYVALVYFAYLPYPLHVAVNPIIYCLLDAKWRKDVKHLLLMIPSRARAYSTTLSTSIRITTRRRSSCGVVIDRLSEDVHLPYLTTYVNVRRQTIEMDVSPMATPNCGRQKHLSDSSGKSIESDCSFAIELQDPF